jgi:hypothetical protein
MVDTITTTLSTAYDQKLGKEIVGSNGRRWKDTVPPSEAMPHRGLHPPLHAGSYGGLAVLRKSVIKIWQQLKAVSLLLVVIDEHRGFVSLDDLPDFFHRFDGCLLICVERGNSAFGEILF